MEIIEISVSHGFAMLAGVDLPRIVLIFQMQHFNARMKKTERASAQ
jgi:hypothetical protein